MIAVTEFQEIVVADFEFHQPPGERPSPICIVAHELISGRKIRLWENELRTLREAPFRTDSHCLFTAYYASAEIGCMLELGWTPPKRILDLYVEFRNQTNGCDLPNGSGLIGAASFFGLDVMPALEKDANRELAIRGGPFSQEEKLALLAYCENDVETLRSVFFKMKHQLDFERAMLRGRYMVAAARIERTGVPIDTQALAAICRHWTEIKSELIREIDCQYGVYENTSFREECFLAWLSERHISWPLHDSGRPKLDDETFSTMAGLHREIRPLQELRATLSEMRLADLTVGSDGRNRCMLSAFRSRTGRNQPSNAKFIFGMPAWFRHLINPEAGRGLAYLDFEQQEFGIAAVLSGDTNMIAAYQSGDPYLAFAKQAGAVPADATKATHGPTRELFKHCSLGVLYGIGPASLAQRIGRPEVYARELLRQHRETYRKFWAWSDRVVDYATLRRRLFTTFGWNLQIGPNANPRTLRNFPMQANGAEMLRLACCFATERGIRVCAPVHDAILIEAPLDELEAVVAEGRRAMADASGLVLDGFELRTDAVLVRHPDRYVDARGEGMWRTICKFIESREGSPQTSNAA